MSRFPTKRGILGENTEREKHGCRSECVCPMGSVVDFVDTLMGGIVSARFCYMTNKTADKAVTLDIKAKSRLQYFPPLREESVIIFLRKCAKRLFAAL